MSLSLTHKNLIPWENLFNAIDNSNSDSTGFKIFNKHTIMYTGNSRDLANNTLKPFMHACSDQFENYWQWLFEAYFVLSYSTEQYHGIWMLPPILIRLVEILHEAWYSM